MGDRTPAKRGPRTPEGKLAVGLNAKKHGILSARPVVAYFERASDWDSHREAITEALAPEGGLEAVLSERVALCSWRLNRVAVYETEAIAQGQESVVEDLRRSRSWDPSVVAIDAHPANPFSDLEYKRDTLRLVEKFAAPPGERLPDDAPVAGPEGEQLLYAAMDAVMDLEEIKAGKHEDRESRHDELMDSLDEAGIPEDGWLSEQDYTASRLMGLFEHLALQESTYEPGHESLTPGEWLLERMHTTARYDVLSAQAKVEKVQAQLLDWRRGRILPKPEDLEKIGRYEAHLSRQMYQALHELEALQARRRLGEGAAPLARLDVQT